MIDKSDQYIWEWDHKFWMHLEQLSNPLTYEPLLLDNL